MYKVIEAPVKNPITLEIMKHHLNMIGFDDEDTYLDLLIKASTKYVQNHIKKFLITQTLEIKVDHKSYAKDGNGLFGSRGLYVPSPANSIVSVKKVIDEVESEVTVTDFKLNNYRSPSIMAPKKDKEWPEADYFLIRLVVGGNQSEVETDIQHAIMILTADAYENRVEQVRDRGNNVKRLLENHRYTEFTDWTNKSETYEIHYV